MLFDLRSRGRRRTVQVVYIGLAILIGAGLVLFGVGTGTGGGGLFGGLSSDSSSHSNSALNAQTKQAIAQTKKSPDSAAAWSNLVSARFSAANSDGYDSSTSTYTSTGTTQLTLLVSAYEKYLALAHTPDATTATIAAKAYSSLNQYANGATAYQAVLQSQPDDLSATECVSLLSYAAGNDRLGALAQASALAKLPKSVRKSTASELEGAKTDKSTASQYCGG